MTDSGRKAYHEAVPFWREDKAMQNFGDFLMDCFVDPRFLRVPRCLSGVRIIGRNLDDDMVRLADRRPRTTVVGLSQPEID
jgi:hypothetical protein